MNPLFQRQGMRVSWTMNNVKGRYSFAYQWIEVLFSRFYSQRKLLFVSPSVPLLHRVLRLVLPANYAIDLLQLVLNVNIKHLLHSR